MTTEPLTTSPSHAATKYRRRRVIAGRVLFCSGLALVLLLVVCLRVAEPWIPSGETVAFDISVLAWAIPAGIATASILISLAAFLSNSRLLRRQEQRDKTLAALETERQQLEIEKLRREPGDSNEPDA